MYQTAFFFPLVSLRFFPVLWVNGSAQRQRQYIHHHLRSRRRTPSSLQGRVQIKRRQSSPIFFLLLVKTVLGKRRIVYAKFSSHNAPKLNRQTVYGAGARERSPVLYKSLFLVEVKQQQQQQQQQRAGKGQRCILSAADIAASRSTHSPPCQNRHTHTPTHILTRTHASTI